MVIPLTVAFNSFAISWADIGFLSSRVNTSSSAAVRNILGSWNFVTRDNIAFGFMVASYLLHALFLFDLTGQDK
jgi:hypothetical protein